MINLRPVGYVIGLLTIVLGFSMLLPLAADVIDKEANYGPFAVSALITVMAGGLVTIACAEARTEGLTIQQTFLLTTGTWVALPFFGALPFMLGAPNASFTDAYFEAMSGLTTTGSTVFVKLEDLPQGTLLWRSLLQWFGGIGIIVVAMAFMPSLKVGGMQVFRSEGFDTFGKILPRAAEIAGSIAGIYVTITVACVMGYIWAGMVPFDALAHAMTTVSTGGFSTHDASIGYYDDKAGVEYVSVLFMLIAALPFVRYVQLISGSAKPLFRDVQVRFFFAYASLVVLVLTFWVMYYHGYGGEEGFRKALFNSVSIITGTGYASTNYEAWGGFATSLFFMIGLIGGCAGSTCCSIKVFRFQLLFATLKSQIRLIHSPNGIFTPRYDGRAISDDVLNSVMAFFVMFLMTLGVLAALLSMTGLDPITSISGAATALANIGPGLGEVIGPDGNFNTLPDVSKWLLSAAMLIGRLELMSVYVIFTAAFWRH